MQVRASVVVAEDLVVRLTSARHPHRAHLAHADAVAKARATEHEHVALALDLEQRRLEATEEAATA